MKKIIILLALCVSFSSCLDLDPKKYEVINSSIFPQNKADAEALVVAAAYGTFRCSHYDGIFNCASGIQVVSDLSTDLGECLWDDSVWGPLLYHYWTPDYSYTNRFYSSYIKDFSKMILAEYRIADVEMSDDERNLLLAELNLAKGWLGYLLYDFYGPVPIPTLNELLDPLQEIIISRPTKEWMVSFIEESLKNAALYLPARYDAGDSNYGRFTKGLAYTILMKLYMHEQDWTRAEAIGRELEKPEYGYELVTNYKDIFTLENEKNREIIFAVQEDRGVSQQLWLAHVLPDTYPTKNPAIQKWNGFRVPWTFFHTYENNDKRLDVLISSYRGTDGILYNESNKDQYYSLSKGVIPLKYGEDPAATGEESQVDWIVYRYADVLTLLSEAIVRQAGVTQEAIDLLNKIRSRAGLSSYMVTDFNSVEEFLDALLLERGHEFFFEGMRRSDLIRHSKYIEYARKKGSTTTKDEFVLMPIHQSVINESKGLILQNPGY